MSNKAKSLATVLAAILLTPLFGAGPSFVPDGAVKGSTLEGWSVLGQADWRAENGEIIGTPKQAAGGWLVLDRPFQDIGFYASFRCAAGCETGVLLRAERTPQGMKGVYVSLTGPEVASYSVALDAQGRELRRTPLRRGGGQMRIAPPPDPAEPATAGGGPRPGPRSGPAVNLPIERPAGEMRPGDWNQIEIYLDANIVRSFLNDSREIAGGVADDDAGSFGPLALYAGGSGEVRFKSVAYKDLSLKVRDPEEVSSNFRMQRVSDFYYAWGVGAADIDHDGVLDVIAGPHYYLGPDYTKSREIYLTTTTNPGLDYTRHCWMQAVYDFTGDGWADLLTASFTDEVGVYLYVNPKGEPRRWDKHLVIPAFQTEILVLKDLDGDGKPELVYGAEGFVRYAKPDPANPTGPWIVRSVSERGYATAHGIGAGDINGDGRIDIVNPFGWWEQPADSKQEQWAYHPEPFGRYGRGIVGGSVMAVYDVNGNGLNDLVTTLNSHGWGLAWFEQKRDASGKISFTRHMIMDDFSTQNAGGVTFSQPHGSTYADVDGDGIEDFIVGKRFWSHRDNYLDPDPYGAAVLYWYRTVRNPNAPGGAEFVPELIHNRSGTGSDVTAVDLNRDGWMDILTSTRMGTFIFWGKPRAEGGRR